MLTAIKCETVVLLVLDDLQQFEHVRLLLFIYNCVDIYVVHKWSRRSSVVHKVPVKHYASKYLCFWCVYVPMIVVSGIQLFCKKKNRLLKVFPKKFPLQPTVWNNLLQHCMGDYTYLRHQLKLHLFYWILWQLVTFVLRAVYKFSYLRMHDYMNSRFFHFLFCYASRNWLSLLLWSYFGASTWIFAHPV